MFVIFGAVIVSLLVATYVVDVCSLSTSAQSLRLLLLDFFCLHWTNISSTLNWTAYWLIAVTNLLTCY
jgi:hypothetical protein